MSCFDPEGERTVGIDVELGHERGRYTTRAVLCGLRVSSKPESSSSDELILSAEKCESASGVSCGWPWPHEAETSDSSLPLGLSGERLTDLYPKDAVKNPYPSCRVSSGNRPCL